jgi:phosphoribosylglycinamide formyltransferase 2
MLDPAALRDLIAHEQPALVVPEIEAIHTPTLVELEREQGLRVIPTARAARLTMDREGIRRLAAETLGLPTSPYRFVDSIDEYRAAVAAIGLPCVVKPVMSSSGKGQSTVRDAARIDSAWEYAQTGGRAGQGRCIVEGFIAFDYEITLLTVRHRDGTSFCDPIGHLQIDGDYRESWMPQPMSVLALQRAQDIASRITENLGGYGLFGVELFVKGDEVWFSEVSPRPHDTGLVTLIAQDLSEFALHARAILGLPIPNIATHGAAASCAVLAHGHGVPLFSQVEAALEEPDTALRLFGKPKVEGHRRVAVTLARGADVEAARAKARRAAAALRVDLV